MLSPSEQTRLDAIEAGLRREAPALDHALSHGLFRGLPDPPRRSRSLQSWPVAALAALGSALFGLGLGLPGVIPLMAGVYLVAFSFVGLWLPLLQTPHQGRPCTCHRNPGLVRGHRHPKHRRQAPP